MSTTGLSAFIDNQVTFAGARPFGAILGLAPSKGARSPLLWRAAFAALGIEADFHPMDVAADRLLGAIEALKADDRYVGGAVAFPHKEQVLPLLDQVDAEARVIGAVNAIYRIGDGGLAGVNTDGIAARDSLVEVAGPLAGRRVLLLGLGGAGKAVATSLLSAGTRLTVCNRGVETARSFVERARTSGGDVDWAAGAADAPWEEIEVMVNCTSCGFSTDGSETTEAPFDLELLGRLKNGATVFDIIYQPLQTALLAAAAARGLKTLNGKTMNLGQAVIAFGMVFPDACSDTITKAMASV